MQQSSRVLSLIALLAVACSNDADSDALIDQDGDGFFVNAPTAARRDCDDRPGIGATAYPGATEICDGIDNDCNGVVDDDYAEGALEWWPDEDGDGYGKRVLEGPRYACQLPRGYSPRRTDCNDNDPMVFPQAPERCNGIDDDCDLQVDEGFDLNAEWHVDLDRDGFGAPEVVGRGCNADPSWVRNGDDCNDLNSEIHPAAVEVCNRIDDDCDGLVDGADEDDLPELKGARLWYPDRDGDGYGSLLGAVRACPDEPPGPGWLLDASDCDDWDPDQHPQSVWYRDADRDGHGDPAVTWPVRQCWQPLGYVLPPDDCDDTDPEEWLGRLWYADADRDGFGFGTEADAVWSGCRPDDLPDTEVWTAIGGDCDDRDPLVNPAAVEVCDTDGPGGTDRDDDCDGLAGDADPDVTGTRVWYYDRDRDGYGTTFGSVRACVRPDGYAEVDGDCDDNDPTRNPSSLWYRDADRDGYGDPLTPQPPQSCTVVPGHVPNGLDCDDTDYYQTPVARWWPDNDGDGLGTGLEPLHVGCVADTTGLASWTGDCDDDDPDDDQGGCYGEQLGTIDLIAYTDTESRQMRIFLICEVGGTDTNVLEVVVQQANATLQRSAPPAATGTSCRVKVEPAIPVDFSGDGPTQIEIRSCGQTVAQHASSIIGDVTESQPFEVGRCSGCADPTALNFDPTVRVPTDSCIY